MTTQPVLSRKILNATVLITSFGYLIDMFDFFLFNVLRIKSLTDLGLAGQALTDSGLFISNCQMAGILLGALFWGVIGDKAGRKTGLFWSIAVYTIGSLASAFVLDVPAYALARFVTGFGLAGELGAGIALITEKLHADKRGNGVLIFISLGFLGVLLAATIASFLPWRTCYLIGGGAGGLLFLARMSLTESGLYVAAKEKAPHNFLSVFRKQPKYLFYFICGTFLLSVGTFTPQIIWTLSPEIGKAMNLPDAVQPPLVLGLGFGCGIIFDMAATFLSEKWRSRKNATLIFLIVIIAIFAFYLLSPPQTMTGFYIFNGAFGFAFGVWVLAVCWIAEHVPTTIRSTIATAAPNFARGLTIPVNLAYAALKPSGTLYAVSIIGTVIFTLAFLGWLGLKETYGRDLNYTE